MGFPSTGGTQEKNVLGTLNKLTPGQFADVDGIG
jgi:hypothetical protein